MAAGVRAARFGPDPHAVVFAPLGDPGRAARVQQRLADAIRSGLLADGERLPGEQQLAGMLGVATVTTREALQALREAGLVRTVRGRGGGSFVQRPGPRAEDALDVGLAGMSLVELRDRATLYRVLLSGCAELAADFAGEQEVAELRELWAPTRPPWVSGPGLVPGEPESVGPESVGPESVGSDPDGCGSGGCDSDRAGTRVVADWRRLGTEFCLSIAALTQSARMVREMIRQEADFGVLLRLPLVRPEVRELTGDYHRALTEAIADHDAALARRTAAEHVDRALAALVERRRAVR